jgi:hypothetical protein
VRLAAAAIWLLPAPPWENYLSRVIAAITARLGSPVFPPHVTLVGRLDPTKLSGVDGELRAAASATQPLSLRLAGIRTGSSFFTALYLEVVLDRAGAQLHDRLARRLGSDELRHHHLSLAYGHFDEAAAEKARDLQIPDRITCDRLALAGSVDAENGWTSIASWRTKVYPLRADPDAPSGV